MTHMKPVLLLLPKTLLKSFAEVNELPLTYRQLTKGRQFAVGGQKLRARRENDSSADLYCFQKNTDGNEGQLIASTIETFSFVQEIDPSLTCAPKEVTFRPEFPTELKLRCLPFGFDEPKLTGAKPKSKKKRKRLGH